MMRLQAGGIKAETPPHTKTMLRVFLSVLVLTSTAAGSLELAQSGAGAQSAAPTEGLSPVTAPPNDTQDRNDPTPCHGPPADYVECEAESKPEHASQTVTDADPSRPVETIESDRSRLLDLAFSGTHDVAYLEAIARLWIADVTPESGAYVGNRLLEVLRANDGVEETIPERVDRLEATANQSVAHEQARATTLPGRAQNASGYATDRVIALPPPVTNTTLRLVETSDDTVPRLPNRTVRAVSEIIPAALESGNRTVPVVAQVVSTAPDRGMDRAERTTAFLEQARRDGQNGTRTADDPTDEGPACNTGGIVEYTRCEAEYKTSVALFLAGHTNPEQPEDTVQVYLVTGLDFAADVLGNDVPYYDDRTNDSDVWFGTEAAKDVTWPVRRAATDDDPDCSGELAEYTRCEGEYKSHVLLTDGANATYPTDTTRTADEWSPVLLHLANDALANDEPYYGPRIDNITEEMREYPRDSTDCSGHVEAYTACEAEYKTEFLLDDTLDTLTSRQGLLNRGFELLNEGLFVAFDAVANDVPYYDDFTYHPAVEGGTAVTKNVTAPTRRAATADDPDCGGEAIEYTRCETEYKSSVVLETGLSRTYPTDLDRTANGLSPVVLALANDALANDVPYYSSADPNDSVTRLLSTVDGITSARPYGPVIAGEVSEAKWRTDPVRETPRDDPACSGDVASYTSCEAEYKSHVVLDDLVDDTEPTDLNRTTAAHAQTVTNLTMDVVNSDVQYYNETVTETLNETNATGSPSEAVASIGR